MYIYIYIYIYMYIHENGRASSMAGARRQNIPDFRGQKVAMSSVLLKVPSS